MYLLEVICWWCRIAFDKSSYLNATISITIILTTCLVHSGIMNTPASIDHRTNMHIPVDSLIAVLQRTVLLTSGFALWTARHPAILETGQKFLIQMIGNRTVIRFSIAGAKKSRRTAKSASVYALQL